MSRNRKIICTPRPNKVWFYSDLAVGDLFRFPCSETDESIYMKTNNPDYCLYLPSGQLYVIKLEKEVVPYNDDLTIKGIQNT